MAMNPVINSLKEEEKINQSASHLRSLHCSWCAERHSGLAVESLTFACRVSGTRKSCSSKDSRGGDCAETAMGKQLETSFLSKKIDTRISHENSFLYYKWGV